MNFDPNKSFPYPVLTPFSDDYKQASFQATPEMLVDQKSGEISLQATLLLSEKNLKSLLSDGLASFGCLVKSPTTFYRSWIEFKKTAPFHFGKGHLAGRITVQPAIVAKRDIASFRSDAFHSAYGKTAFNIRAGSMLAMVEPSTFHISNEPCQKISSVFELVAMPEIKEDRFEIDCSNDKIIIGMPDALKNQFIDAQQESKKRPALVCGVYLPAVCEVLIALSKKPEEYEDSRWYVAFSNALEEISVGIESVSEDNALELAQKLLKFPVGKLVEEAG